MANKVFIITAVLALIALYGCATDPGLKPPSRDNDIEQGIEALADKLVAELKGSKFAMEKMAIMDGSSMGSQVISQFSNFIMDRLRQKLTMKRFSIVDMENSYWKNHSAHKPLGSKGLRCEDSDAPQIILFLSVKDYGENSKMVYVNITGKEYDSQRFIEGFGVEEKFYRSDRIVSWLNDQKYLPLPPGTQGNPFKTVDRGAEFLANSICCPYKKLIQKYERDGFDIAGVSPEDVVMVIMAVNSETHKMGRFERVIMQKLKTYLIKNCDIENAVDFSDYALVDKQLAFYEKEGTFKLDFSAKNRERFKPGTVLLIVETYYRSDSKVDVMAWACWMKDEAEALSGGKLRVGGTYLPGFATSAYFTSGEAEAIVDPQVSVHVSGTVGTNRFSALMESGLVEKGYSVVPLDSKDRKWTVEARLNAIKCFEEIDSCYTFTLESLRIRNKRNAIIQTLPVSIQGKETYMGLSDLTDNKATAIRTGIDKLWTSMQQDFLDAFDNCVN